MLEEILDDLRAESRELDALVSGLDDDGWRADTPAKGWTVMHQISHLAWTDRMALIAATDMEAFAAELAKAATDPANYMEEGAQEGLSETPRALLARWRAGREALADALRAAPPKAKIPWYGPPMATASVATARLMETWAHGLDVFEALGAAKRPTARLRHVAHLGVRTRVNGFLAQGREVPDADVYVELTAPDGGVWPFGDPASPERLTGPALDFCLLVTRRRHRDDLALVATGKGADEWLDVAQCFAGPPGDGRRPEGRPVPAGDA